VDRDGGMWCWGVGVVSGHPGDDNVLVPSRVRGAAGFVEVLFVAARRDHSLAVTSGNALWA